MLSSALPQDGIATRAQYAVGIDAKTGRRGFEPPSALWTNPASEAGAFSHSATSPNVGTGGIRIPSSPFLRLF